MTRERMRQIDGFRRSALRKSAKPGKRSGRVGISVRLKTSTPDAFTKLVEARDEVRHICRVMWAKGYVDSAAILTSVYIHETPVDTFGKMRVYRARLDARKALRLCPEK